MRIKHEIKVTKITTKIEKLQGEQKKIVEKLFSINNRIFEKLINTLSEKTGQFHQVLTDAAINIERSIKSSFSEIISELTHAQEYIFNSFEEILESSTAATDLNDDILRKVDTLFNFVDQIVPDTIRKIFNEMTSSTKEIHEQSKAKISELENTLEILEEHESMASQEKENAKNSIRQLSGQVILLEDQLKHSNAALTDQRANIEKVDTELKSLEKMADELSEIANGEEYIHARKIVDRGIVKFLSPNSASLKEEYAKDTSYIDNEVNDIIHHYNKIVSMINIAEKMATTIKKKIQEIILINTAIGDKNTSVAASVDKMSGALINHKTYIAELKSQIDKLQDRYEIARNERINDLKDQITSMKGQEKKIENLTAALQEKQKWCDEMVEKTTVVLREQFDSLKNDNDILKAEKKELRGKIDSLNEELSSAKKESQQKANLASSHESRLRETVIGVFAESMKRFDDIGNEIKQDSQKTFEKQKKNQRMQHKKLEKVNHRLNKVKIDISNTTDIFRGIKHDPAANPRITNNQENINKFKMSCLNLIKSINEITKKRLQDESEAGRKKWNWMNNIAASLEKESLSTQDFLNSFRSILIVYLQNKNGNKWYHFKRTATGKKLVTELNQTNNKNLRELLFGQSDNITYDMLAGRLLSDHQATETALTMMKQDNNKDVTLTINQFTLRDSSLTSLALEKMLEMEEISNNNNNLQQENIVLQEKIYRVKKKAKHNKKEIAEKIEKIVSQPVNMSSYNPFLFATSTNPFDVEEVREAQAMPVC